MKDGIETMKIEQDIEAGMRRFFLCEFETVGQGNQRDVAEGVEFSDGAVVMRWLGETPSTVVHKSMPDLTSIHVVNHRSRFVRWADDEPATRAEDMPQRWWAAWSRGMSDCCQDRCENSSFSSVGGLDGRVDMRAPSYVEVEDSEAYLRGYAHQARAMFGEDWRTCTFGWHSVLTIGSDGEGDGPT